MKDKLLKIAPAIFAVTIICYLLFSLFMQISIGTEGYSQKQPFIFNPDDVAVNQNSIYLMDDFSNIICAYDLEGNFLYMISFDEGSGLDYVYVNERGNLCRIRERGDILYEYDQNGNQISTISLKNGLPKRNHKTFAKMDDIHVELKNSPFYPSRIIVSNAHQEPNSFAVQNTNWYLLKTSSAVLVIATVFGGFFIGIRVIHGHKKQTDSD